MTRKIYLFSINSHPDTLHVNPLHVEFFYPKIDFSIYDKIILTSKQATKALSYYPKQNFLHLSGVAISQQTAKSYEDMGAKVEKIAQGYGADIAEIVKEYPKSTRWLYLRGKEVASDFAKMCQNMGYLIDEKIVYETSCSAQIKEVSVEKDAILIFTSPSAVTCFLAEHSFEDTQDIIVIGKTTAKKIPSVYRCYIAEETTIDSCVNLAKTLSF